MPLRWLQQAMTWREFVGWYRYYGQQPFDDARCFDLPSAQLQALYANAHKPSARQPFTVTEFMPFQLGNDELAADEALMKLFEDEEV